jgi:hypothetical protein
MKLDYWSAYYTEQLRSGKAIEEFDEDEDFNIDDIEAQWAREDAESQEPDIDSIIKNSSEEDWEEV